MKWIIALIEKKISSEKLFAYFLLMRCKQNCPQMTSMCLQKIQGQGAEGFNKLKTQLSMNINSHKYHAMYFFTSDG